MKRNIFYTLITFILIFLFHMGYYIWKVSQISKDWIQIEDISSVSLYFKQQDFFLGYSYALAGAFTIYALIKFLQNRRSGVAGIVGGFTLTGILYIGGCFLLGCCGSPMLAVYLSLFGSSFLGFTKPLIATITTISVVIGYFWIEKKSKICCDRNENSIDPAKGNHMDRLYKKGLRLEYFTVGYNIIEAVVSIVFGSIANSIALVGFGLDSIVESLSGFVLIWRLSQHKKISEDEEEKIEKKAMKFVSMTFFILGLYVLFQSMKKLILKEIPDPSLPGIIIATVSIIVMPILTFQKYKVGKQMNSRALVADSKETLACSFLSLTLLLGLGLNYLFGFWQADPMVGLIIVIFLFREGLEGWKESNGEVECFNGTKIPGRR